MRAIVAFGRACMRSAARPAMCGVAIDVPSMSCHPPPGFADVMPHARSDEVGHQGVPRPLEPLAQEKSATVWSLSIAPTESDCE